MFPVRYTAEQLQKRTKEEARAEDRSVKQGVIVKESRNKSAARKRDGWACRFPRCACLLLRLHPEVAHVDGDKGIGGDHGERSHVTQLMCLCKLRHQHGESRISLHRKTLRIEFLSPAKASGPVRWWVNVAVLDYPLTSVEDWRVVAQERECRVLEPLTHEQGQWLERIADLALKAPNRAE